VGELTEPKDCGDIDVIKGGGNREEPPPRGLNEEALLSSRFDKSKENPPGVDITAVSGGTSWFAEPP